MLLAAWLLGEQEKGEWLVSSILASFSSYHTPRAKAVAGQAPDEVEVTAWRTAADRCPLDDPSPFMHMCLHAAPISICCFPLWLWPCQWHKSHNLQPRQQKLEHVGVAVLTAIAIWDAQSAVECRFARLMLFAGMEQEAALVPIFAALEEKLQALYTRPYLAQGSAEKALLMLDSLLQVCF